MIGETNLGQRVVVRRFAGIGTHGRPTFTDLLGELTALDDDQLTIRTADGREHTVARADVAAAKPVPPRPPRYSEIVALEWAAASTWPAPTSHRLGDWLLRSGEGWTNRANSALPLGEPGLPLEEAIEAVIAWYTGQGRPAAITTPLPVARRVNEALRARGWRPEAATAVRTAALSELLDRTPARTDLPEVGLPRTPSTGWLDLVAGRKKGLPAVAHHVLTGVPGVRFAELRVDGALAAIARGALSSDGEWLGLALIEVTREHRRQGLARHVMRALAGWATGLGARRAFLQVLESNEAAIALYDGVGFTTHHRYETLRP